jgi:hypothetical protein
MDDTEFSDITEKDEDMCRTTASEKGAPRLVDRRSKKPLRNDHLLQRFGRFPISARKSCGGSIKARVTGKEMERILVSFFDCREELDETQDHSFKGSKSLKKEAKSAIRKLVIAKGLVLTDILKRQIRKVKIVKKKIVQMEEYDVMGADVECLKLIKDWEESEKVFESLDKWWALWEQGRENVVLMKRLKKLNGAVVIVIVKLLARIGW